jgi:hypothetical protein
VCVLKHRVRTTSRFRFAESGSPLAEGVLRGGGGQVGGYIVGVALHASSCDVDKMGLRVTDSYANAEANAIASASASADADAADAADAGSISCRSAERGFPPLETSYK